ncbi:MAG TPA: hypothetical protein DCO79_16920 [Spirochaeta sp.]|nr:hypothetical protein [Spirochaeta sp.]
MTNKEWDKISSRVRAVYNFGVEKSEWFKVCKMARLIAAVPFLAGCDKPEESSFTHLAVYIMSIDDSTKDIYFHKAEDDADVYSRLQPISNFNGGNRKVIQCCMDLIALNMVTNYEKDAEEDKAIGKYNPVEAGAWNYGAVSEKLIEDIKSNITSEISEVYTVDDALRGLWKD